MVDDFRSAPGAPSPRCATPVPGGHVEPAIAEHLVDAMLGRTSEAGAR